MGPMQFFKKLFGGCRHEVLNNDVQEKIKLTEPWSSESGYKKVQRLIKVCQSCGKKIPVTKWVVIQQRAYGQIWDL